MKTYTALVPIEFELKDDADPRDTLINFAEDFTEIFYEEEMRNRLGTTIMLDEESEFVDGFAVKEVPYRGED